MRINQDIVLGVLAVLFGLGVMFLWAPVDSDTGLAEKVRGRWSIGDALAPTAAGVLILLSGLGIVAAGLRVGGAATLTSSNALYLAKLLGILVPTFLAVRYLGDGIASVFGLEYRPLRDTVPWKYLGFVLGGGGMIFVLISLMEHRIALSRLALALAIATGLALIYDLPFEDLLLPPNGDV